MNTEFANHRLLIISNNVLSMTRSNGKVIMSYFDCLPKENVRQLYFSSELPSIQGYKYYQISDRDIIKGFFYKSLRGRSIVFVDENNYKLYKQNPSKVKTPFFRILRECLWSCKRWLSPQLLSWLDEYNPTDIFFVGGDSIFAYNICHYIVERYDARLAVYITDDYILQRETDGVIASVRRKMVKKELSNCLSRADTFFTISKQMQETYKQIFGKDSYLVTNMSDPLRDKSIHEDTDVINLLYAGSLYYGRAEILGLLARELANYNRTSDIKAKLKIFTNVKPSEAEMRFITVSDASEYCGRLTKEELIIEMNRSHILCIVESFDEEQIESTRLSLSTKVSEYMSVGKPILAIGPADIGTISYLSDVAVCITCKEDIGILTKTLLQSHKMREEYGNRSFNKYLDHHVKEVIQAPFIEKVFGENLGLDEERQ